MAKSKTSPTATGVKPLTSRPLDLIYYIFFVVHLLISLTIDLLPLWPEQLRTLPVTKHVFETMKGVADDFMKQTNDPFGLVMWGLVDREWEFVYVKVFIWMEVFIQIPSFIVGIIGLQRNSPRVYPALLAYSSAALVTTITYIIVAWTAPSVDDPNVHPLSKFFAMTDSGRSYLIGATLPFLVIPAIMWVDMMVRIGRLVNAGIKAGKMGAVKKNA